jgi:hypothetical protein
MLGKVAAPEAIFDAFDDIYPHRFEHNVAGQSQKVSVLGLTQCCTPLRQAVKKAQTDRK